MKVWAVLYKTRVVLVSTNPGTTTVSYTNANAQLHLQLYIRVIPNYNHKLYAKESQAELNESSERYRGLAVGWRPNSSSYR